MYPKCIYLQIFKIRKFEFDKCFSWLKLLKANKYIWTAIISRHVNTKSFNFPLSRYVSIKFFISHFMVASCTQKKQPRNWFIRALPSKQNRPCATDFCNHWLPFVLILKTDTEICFKLNKHKRNTTDFNYCCGDLQLGETMTKSLRHSFPLLFLETSYYLSNVIITIKVHLRPVWVFAYRFWWGRWIALSSIDGTVVD